MIWGSARAGGASQPNLTVDSDSMVTLACRFHGYSYCSRSGCSGGEKGGVGMGLSRARARYWCDVSLTCYAFCRYLDCVLDLEAGF